MTHRMSGPGVRRPSWTRCRCAACGPVAGATTAGSGVGMLVTIDGLPARRVAAPRAARVSAPGRADAAGASEFGRAVRRRISPARCAPIWAVQRSCDDGRLEVAGRVGAEGLICTSERLR